MQSAISKIAFFFIPFAVEERLAGAENKFYFRLKKKITFFFANMPKKNNLF